MPRPRKLQPDYCHQKTTGRAFVRVGGRQVWLGQYGTQASKDKYLAVVAEWVARGRPAADTETPTQKLDDGKSRNLRDLNTPLSGPTLTLVIEPYWNFGQGYYRKNDRPTDEIGCIKVVLRLLRKLYGDLPVAQFDSLKMLAVQQAMIDEGWARKTINDHMGRMKRALKWLASRKYIPATIYHESLTISGLEKGRSKARETDRKKPVPQEHVDAVLPFLSRQVATMVRVERFAFIQEHLAGRFPLDLVCQVLEVSRSGYYAWSTRPASTRALRRDALAEKIRLVHEQTRKVYGSPRVQGPPGRGRRRL